MVELGQEFTNHCVVKGTKLEVKGSSGLAQRMVAIEVLPQELFPGAEQKVSIAPGASQSKVAGTVGAARLRGDLPFALGQTLGLEEYTSLATFHLMELEAPAIAGSRQQLQFGRIRHCELGGFSAQQRSIPDGRITGRFETPPDGLTRLFVGSSQAVDKNTYHPITDLCRYIGMIREEPLEGVAFKHPQESVNLGLRGCGTGGGIEQSHLSKKIAGLKVRQYDINLIVNVLADNDSAPLDNIERVRVVQFAKDYPSRFHLSGNEQRGKSGKSWRVKILK
jgi:hypothetical protein